MFKVVKFSFFLLIILILPFILLIRISIYTHVHYHLQPYLCTLVGVIVTSLLLVFYITVIRVRLIGALGSQNGLKLRSIGALVIVFAYAFHGLMFFSSSNAQNSNVRKEFKELHPILRLGVSTLVHIDKKLILTDAERKPEDYRKMGLKKNQHSLHYPQKDGFVYALDMRTRRRSELRNTLTRIYFRMMGFKTLRHGGTGDHLHISLYNHESPHSH